MSLLVKISSSVAAAAVLVSAGAGLATAEPAPDSTEVQAKVDAFVKKYKITGNIGKELSSPTWAPRVYKNEIAATSETAGAGFYSSDVERVTALALELALEAAERRDGKANLNVGVGLLKGSWKAGDDMVLDKQIKPRDSLSNRQVATRMATSQPCPERPVFNVKQVGSTACQLLVSFATKDKTDGTPEAGTYTSPQVYTKQALTILYSKGNLTSYPK